MLTCVLGPLRVHISVRLHLGVDRCVYFLFVCVGENVSVGAAQGLKRPWDEYVEQM